MRYFLLTLFLVPILALAWHVPGHTPDDPPGYDSNTTAITDRLVPCEDDCDYQDLLELIKRIFSFLLYIAVPICSLVIAYAGIKMVVSRTNAGEVEQAKKILWAAVIGLVIVLAAWLIVDTVLKALTDHGINEVDQILTR